MDLSEIRTLYLRELRAALRERSIVVNSILLPIFLYPLLLWLVFTGITFVQGLEEGFVSRIAVFGVPVAHWEVVDSLRASELVELQDTFPSPEAAAGAVRAGELDAAVEFRPSPWDPGVIPREVGDSALPGPPPPAGEDRGSLLSSNFSVHVAYDRSEGRSETARRRAEGVIERYRDRWLEREGRALGLSTEELAVFRVERRNVSSEREMGAFLLAEMIPVFLVIMVALGCFVPAIDATAGERERGTWETTMSLAASRSSVVAAKYLYVVTLGATAGVLNILAMTASLGTVVGAMFGDATAALEFDYPSLAVPVMVIGALLLALFFAAAMMIVAAFARTFKDGQSMVTPIYLLALVPIVLGRAPDQHLTPALALVPIANVAIMIRDAIQGVFRWLLIGESIVVGVALVAGCLALARWILSFEDVLLGSYRGSLWKFLRERGAGG